MRNEKEQWYCEWANSLGTLEDTAENVWGTLPYDENKHPDENVVFFGLYGFPSFFKLWKHKGRKVIFWAGSDIRHFLNGYWLDKKGEIRLDLKALALWINAECENWVENEVEQKALAHIGIVSKICPSFLGDTDKFEISYEASNAPKLYTSISGDDFELYQWQKTMDIASQRKATQCIHSRPRPQRTDERRNKKYAGSGAPNTFGGVQRDYRQEFAYGTMACFSHPLPAHAVY